MASHDVARLQSSETKFTFVTVLNSTETFNELNLAATPPVPGRQIAASPEHDW